MTDTRVLVVEDHPLYRHAVVSLVNAMDGWTVVGAFQTAAPAIAEAGTADLVVLDLGLPDIDGIDAAARFRTANPDLAILVLTMSDDPTVFAAALRAGAHGYLVKGSEPAEIERALRGVANGQAVFGSHVAATALANAGKTAPTSARLHFPMLTERELEVLDLVAAGMTNTDIAAALVVSPKTARNHVSSILTKLGYSRQVAIARARDAGLGR